MFFGCPMLDVVASFDKDKRVSYSTLVIENTTKKPTSRRPFRFSTNMPHNDEKSYEGISLSGSR